MLRKRIIPCLLINDVSLVKTVQFSSPKYIGDPLNTCKIFNELEVDEICFLDINASRSGLGPNFELLSEVANECFMPAAYGGGVHSLDIAEKIFKLGFEKVVLNSSAIKTPALVTEISNKFGAQSVIVSIDVKKNFWGKKLCRGMSGKLRTRFKPEEWSKEVQKLGAGEILLTSIDREGTWEGFDLELVKSVSDSVDIPVIAHGGGGSIKDISDAIEYGGASAVALGSLVVFQGKGKGVLVNFPDSNKLKEFI